MKVILSEQCKSLTGSLGRGFGYAIQRRKNGYFAKRNAKGHVPPDGHWRFILTCAQLAHQRLHIVDVQLTWEELHDALREARLFIPARHVLEKYQKGIKSSYNAADIINTKYLFGL